MLPVLVGLIISPMSVGALYPSDPSSVESLKADFRGKNLQNTEYVKYDISGVDASDADLQGAYFSVSDARNANFHGANLKDVIAYATRFDNADLSDSIFVNGELMKSVFDGAAIEGADFTNANLDLSQQKALCERASGKNSKTGVETSASLDCGRLSGTYVNSISE